LSGSMSENRLKVLPDDELAVLFEVVLPDTRYNGLLKLGKAKVLW